MSERTSESRRERADAIRNRRAILAATEELLATHRPQDISMEQVAAAAGVGKGTVFHRFGNRTGLMQALMYQRAHTLGEAVTGGPPPLGPGAPARDRLLAFLDAIVEVVSRNKSLMAELARSGLTDPPPDKAGQADRAGQAGQAGQAAIQEQEEHPVYWFWHGHVSALISAQRPGIDADLIAHLMLGAMHSEPVLAQLASDGPERLSAAMRALACAVLDAPPLDAPAALARSRPQAILLRSTSGGHRFCLRSTAG